ncbi:MAG: hypothetical protein R3224_05660 [Balneolaceae bacterium]|nr:hypothetical protein [Balneolaceae bacterium]
MDDRYRFDRDEIANILKRASELEHRNREAAEEDEDRVGLTLQELREVAGDVGIDPGYVQQAIEELSAPAPPVFARLLGGPFSHFISEEADRPLDDTTWEEVVTEIRKIHGGIGKTGKRGNTYEWEQRKREVGYIQISLASKEDHTRIHLNANYRYHAIVTYLLTGILGLVGLSLLLKNFQLPFLTGLIASVSTGLGLFAGARFYLSNWMKNKRATYRKLVDRFKDMLGAGSSAKSKRKKAEHHSGPENSETETGIEIPETGDARTSEEPDSPSHRSRQQ